MDRTAPKGRTAAALAAHLARTLVALLLCTCFAATAREPPADPEVPQTTAEARPTAEKSAEFKPPPGFLTQKRRGLVVYCRREAVLGTRFKAEKCYDRDGIEDLMRAEREKLELLDKVRNCGVGSCQIG